MRNNKEKNNREGISRKFIGFILIFLGISIGALIYIHVYYNLSADVVAVIVPAILAISGWFFTTEHQRIENKKDRELQIQLDHDNRKHEIELEHKRRISEIQLQSYEQRKEIYKKFTDLLLLFAQGLEGKNITPEELNENMVKISFEFLLIGSEEVCKLWLEVRKLVEMQRNEKMNLFMMILLARIVLAFRRDLGNENTTLDEVDVLRSYTNNLTALEPKIRELMTIKSVEEFSEGE